MITSRQTRCGVRCRCWLMIAAVTLMPVAGASRGDDKARKPGVDQKLRKQRLDKLIRENRKTRAAEGRSKTRIELYEESYKRQSAIGQEVKVLQRAGFSTSLIRALLKDPEKVKASIRALETILKLSEDGPKPRKAKRPATRGKQPLPNQKLDRR